MTKKIIVGITGASGFVYALRLIAHLKAAEVQIHLLLTDAAQITRDQEVGVSLADLKKQVDVYHPIQDVGANIASGSFHHDGMVIVPCSMNTLAELSCGISNNLLTRAADVCLKERRTLIVMPRETPLHRVHLQNMMTLSELGAIVYPPMPAFYHRPQTLEEMIDQTLGRVLSMLGIEQQLTPAWQGWR